MRLRSYLGFLVAAVILPVAIFGVTVGYILIEHDRETFRRGAEERTLAMITAIDAQLTSSIATLEALSTARALDDGDLATFRDHAERVLVTQSEWININLALPSGQQVMDLRSPQGAVLPDISALDPQWRGALAPGSAFISDLIFRPASGQWDFAARVPVQRGGSVKYVLSALVKPQSIRELLEQQEIPTGWVAVVLDRSDRIVARTYEPEKSVGQVASQSLRDALAQSRSGWFRGTTIEGNAVYTPYRRSRQSDWVFAMGVPASVVDAVAWRGILLLAIGLTGSIALAVFLARLIGMRISRPIAALAASTEAIGKGEAVQIRESAPVAEIRTLEAALRTSVHAIGERARLLDLSHDAIFVRDLEDRVVYWNAGAEGLYGWSRDEALGQITHELLRTEHPEPLETILETVRAQGHWSGDLGHYRRDGTRIVVASRWALERDADGRPVRTLEINSDVTDRTRAEVSLKEADRAKDEFLATLGHELRNPLAALMNAAHVVKFAAPGGADAIKARSVVERQTRHMTRLIEDLLDLSRITLGKVTLKRKAFDLAGLAADVVRIWQPRSKVAQVLITLGAAHPAWIEADRGRLEQVLANLLDNALKFSKPRQRIVVTVQRDGAEAVLSVSDQGVGISPEAIGHIFEQFVQGEHGPERTKSGLGIGLALVKRLVQMHGGRVQARSAGVGLGASFLVRLPAIEPSSAQADSARIPAVPRPIGARRILLVEDNADAREMLRVMLSLGGHLVSEAADGSSGVAAAQGQHPDIALIDLGLPDIDGFEVARRIRANGTAPRIRLVALTGYGQEDDVRRALAAGFDLHLTKPVDPAMLKEVFSSLV